MMMRTLKALAIASLCLPLVCSAVVVAPAKTNTSSLPIKGEADDTDTYAVPLDDDEEESNEEMQSLEEAGKKAEKAKSK